MDQYPGIPDRFEVKCPLCFADLTLLLTTAEVRRVVNEETISDMAGNSRSWVREQRVEADIHASIHHLCPKIPVTLTQHQHEEWCYTPEVNHDGECLPSGIHPDSPMLQANRGGITFPFPRD